MTETSQPTIVMLKEKPTSVQAVLIFPTDLEIQNTPPATLLV